MHFSRGLSGIEGGMVIAMFPAHVMIEGQKVIDGMPYKSEGENPGIHSFTQSFLKILRRVMIGSEEPQRRVNASSRALGNMNKEKGTREINIGLTGQKFPPQEIVSDFVTQKVRVKKTRRSLSGVLLRKELKFPGNII